MLILVTGSIWCERQVKTGSDAVHLSLSRQPLHMVTVRSDKFRMHWVIYSTSIGDFLKVLRIHIQLQETVWQLVTTINTE